VIALCTPPSLFSIGEWYEDFEQLDDTTVVRLLNQHRQERAAQAASADAPRE
jgi:predicted phosphoribosyltransferase